MNSKGKNEFFWFFLEKFRSKNLRLKFFFFYWSHLTLFHLILAFFSLFHFIQNFCKKSSFFHPEKCFRYFSASPKGTNKNDCTRKFLGLGTVLGVATQNSTDTQNLTFSGFDTQKKYPIPKNFGCIIIKFMKNIIHTHTWNCTQKYWVLGIVLVWIPNIFGCNCMCVYG